MENGSLQSSIHIKHTSQVYINHRNHSSTITLKPYPPPNSQIEKND